MSLIFLYNLNIENRHMNKGVNKLIDKTTLSLIQDTLGKNLINLNLFWIDEYKYNLLINQILLLVNTIVPEINLPILNIANKFSNSYIIINSTEAINELSGNLTIFLELENHVIKNVEVSIIN